MGVEDRKSLDDLLLAEPQFHSECCNEAPMRRVPRQYSFTVRVEWIGGWCNWGQQRRCVSWRRLVYRSPCWFESVKLGCGLVARIDFSFDLRAVDPCEALRLGSLMSSNTAKAFATFEDVDAMSFFDLLWCCRPFVINGPK